MRAAVVVFLLSDASVGVNGQIVRVEIERLSFITHPAVAHPRVAIPTESWSVDRIAEAFRDDLAQRQFPLGVTTVTVEQVLGAGDIPLA